MNGREREARTVSLPYGKGSILVSAPLKYCLAIPEVLKIEPRDDGPSPESIVAAALEQPIGRQSLVSWLKPSDRIVIVVPDLTRMSACSIYLKPLIAQLDRVGIPTKNISFIVAVGNHRENTDEEITTIVGPSVFERFKPENHNPFGELVEFGSTSSGNRIRINRKVAEADKIIFTGAAAYHIFAGYSGGRKSLLPGVSASETILYNHSLMFKGRRADENAAMGILRGNPVNEDMIEALRLVGSDRMFILNSVCDPRGRIIGAFAGCPLEAHKKACEFVSEQFSVDFSGGFDIIVMSSGGYPFDSSFYQAYKGAYCLLDALNPGGSLFILAECPEGYGEKAGNTDFWFSKSMTSLLECCEESFDMNGKVAFDIRQIAKKAGNAYLVTEGNEKLASIIDIRRIEPADFDVYLGNIISRFKAEYGKYPKICFVPFGTWTLVKNKNLHKDFTIPDY